MESRDKKVLVFAERMLPSTQTFIPLQVNALTRYQPQYVGLIPADKNYPLEHAPIMLTSDRTRAARIRREAYRWTGVAPGFHAAVCSARADILHGHFAEGGPAAVFLADAAKLPLMLHLRGGAELMADEALQKQLFQRPYLAWRERLWKRASMFLCVSEFIKSKAIKAGFPEAKLRVHYTGMNLKKFTPVLPVAEMDPSLVLYVGRLVPYKGCDYLLRAMAQVQQRQPDAHLVVIGDGTFRPELERLAGELGIRCRFLGERPQSEIHQWLDKARVFCAPSVTLADGMSEAFGNVFSEAQAMGVPVVSSRHGGIPETMKEGVTGLLAEERDVEMLAAHLLRYLEDDGFWAASREEGLRWVRSRFDVQKQTACLENIYDVVRADFRPGEKSQEAVAVEDS
ncbi:glycosyltransferase involved in cell wall biosynthesis [Granulicella aggregans]|uniref:Glycosyltransferase involved in cell wall biosynthesis n=1 Tax=Granulicella aggregans TaxID=474949 RepID=A0A7W8E2Q9_9BACT|nr:glycosyltransferase [Granulicella aggregans]MBB5057153.1 glycosyltransferase involved in cell wall biosynthesis [Granulicella aggregans]